MEQIATDDIILHLLQKEISSCFYKLLFFHASDLCFEFKFELSNTLLFGFVDNNKKVNWKQKGEKKEVKRRFQWPSEVKCAC